MFLCPSSSYASVMSDVHSGFVRQRRGLMLISFILSTVLLFGISGTEIRVAPGGGSVSLDVGETKYIVYALWAAWVWFLYRYWQHFLVARIADLESLQNDQRPKVKRAFLKPMLERGERALRRHLEGEYSKAEEFRIVGVALNSGPQRDGWKRVYGVVKAEAVALVKDGRAKNLGTQTALLELKRPWIWPRLCVAIFLVNFKHRYFSEFWIAYIIALVPVVVAFAKHWNAIL